MTLRNAFGDLATEATQLDERTLLEGMFIALMQIADKLPRVDAADRVVVNTSELTTTVAIAANQTIAGLTNVGGRDVAHLAFALSNSGAMHIYNNIQVT